LVPPSGRDADRVLALEDVAARIVPHGFAAAPAIRHAIKWLGNRAFRRKRGPALPGDSRGPTERPATGVSLRRSICNSYDAKPGLECSDSSPTHGS